MKVFCQHLKELCDPILLVTNFQRLNLPKSRFLFQELLKCTSLLYYFTCLSAVLTVCGVYCNSFIALTLSVQKTKVNKLVTVAACYFSRNFQCPTFSWSSVLPTFPGIYTFDVFNRSGIVEMEQQNRLSIKSFFAILVKISIVYITN